MNIYIIRHGQTSSNKKGQYYGSLDVPLNKKGVRQMENLRPNLSQIVFDRVYSSPSSRALESLKICGHDLYNRVQRDYRLRELNFGDFEGQTYEEIKKLYPEEVASWQKDWKNFCPPGGESFVSFYANVIAFFKEVLESKKVSQPKKENILIMAHSGVIKSIYCYVLQNNIDLYWNFTCHNGKINIIKYEYENLFIDGMNQGAL